MADQTSPPVAGALDQSEIDRLLAQTAEAAAPKQQLLRADGSRSGSDLKVEAYDFRNPAFLSEIELRRLRLVHEDFIRYLSARLSLHLRMEFGVKMSKLTTVTYAKFTESLANPSHLSLFKIEPLLGVGILDINPRLALTFADRLLGGRGHSVKAERYLTEIEVSLIEDVVVILLEEWCGQWKLEKELRPVLIGHENNGRFLQTSPKDAIVLALLLETTFGDCSEQIQIGVPYYLIEPVVSSPCASSPACAWVTSSRCPPAFLPKPACCSTAPPSSSAASAMRPTASPSSSPANSRPRNPTMSNTLAEEKTLDIVLDVKVKVTVQLGSVQLPMRDVLELAPGSVVQLMQHASDPVGLFVNDKLIAYGEVVVVEDNFGIKITELVGSVKA